MSAEPTSTSRISFLQVTLACSLIGTAAIALSVLNGWRTGQVQPLSWGFGPATTRPSTALVLLILAVAAWLHLPNSRPYSKRLNFIATLLVAFVGLVTAEAAIGWLTGFYPYFQNLLVPEAVTLTSGQAIGRMGRWTTLCCIAAIVFLLSFRRNRLWVPQLCLLIQGAVALIHFGGYALYVMGDDWVRVHSQTAFPAAIALTLLTVAQVCLLALDRHHRQQQVPDWILHDVQLANAARFAANIVVITDAPGLIIWVNNAFTALTGFTLAEAVGRRPGELLQGVDTDPKTVAYMRERVRALEPFQCEVLNYRKDGTPYWLSIDAQPVRDARGKVVKFVAVECDVTTRKLAELAEEAERRRAEEIIASTPGIVWEIDLKSFRFTYVSPAAENILGYPVCDWLTHENFWAEHLHPEDGARTLEFCRAQTAEGKDHEIEYRMRAKDGRYVWLHDAIRVIIRDERPVLIRGVMVDITQRKEAERKARLTETRLARLVSSAPGLVYESHLTAEGQMGFEYLSQGANLSFVDASAQDLPDDAQSAQIVSEDVPLMQAALRESAEKLTPLVIAVRYRRADGSIRWVQTRSTPHRTPEGQTRWLGFLTDVTEIKEAEIRQEQLNLRLQLALRASRLGVCRFNLQTGESECDCRTLEIYGVPEIRSMEEFDQAIHPDDRGWMNATWEHLRTDVKAMTGQFRIKRNDAQVRHISYDFFVTNDASGKPEWVTGVIADTTDRVSDQERLQYSFWQLESVFESVAEGVIVQAPDGRITQANRAACRILGLSEDELLDRDTVDTRWSIIRPDGTDFPGDEYPASICLRTGQPQRGVSMGVKRHDGTTVWISVNSQPLRGPDGKITHAVTSFSDITELVTTDRELRQSSERLQHALVTARLVWWEWNLSSGYCHVNACGAPCILGYESNTLLSETGDSWLEKTHPEDRTLAKTSLQAALDGTAAEWSCEHRLRAGDGSWRWIRQNGQVTKRAPDGKALFMVGTTQDIDSAKKTELERRLLEEQITHAQKLESLGTLAGGIAHDINNLLTGINGYAEMAALDLPLDHPARASVSQVRSIGLRARDLVRRLLLIARRSPTLELGPVNVGDLIEEIARLLRPGLPHEILIHHEAAPCLPAVQGDISQLHQVILNLATNASQALTLGRGEIRLSARPADVAKDSLAAQNGCRPGPALVVSVSDNGTGMNEATLARIFDPFFTTKGKGKGTGLGLAITHSIVQAHEGCIIVHSQLGRGSTFEVWLPCESQAKSNPPLPASPPKSIEPKPPSGSGQRILVVDDEPSVADFTSTCLERLGYWPARTTAPTDAFALVSSNPVAFELLIVDMTMPIMSGAELVRRIRRLRPNLPVIFATGDPSKINQQELDIGSYVVLQKPYSLVRLAEAVSQQLSANSPKV